MNEAFLLTGGNIGNRKMFLDKAAKEIEKRCGKILARSSIFETAAWGKEDQAPFYNQVLEIGTNFNAKQLMKTILLIEEDLGRKRAEKYGSRTIDIDILFFGDEVIEEAELVIPHPRMVDRRFVLEPLNEIAPEKIHPVLHKTIARLLEECTDTLDVNKIIDDFS
jgi:2-amino-4-hydroxy-6-hydroxymethyldihydropteridine diphosphokinase